MAHKVSAPDQTLELPHVRRLWRILLEPERHLRQKLGRLFDSETEMFGFESAFFARIDRNADTEHFEVVHNPGGALQEGNTVPLSHTYCRQTITEPSGTMAITDASNEGWAGDPAYERFGFESYLGTTVSLEEELYGTLCFVDTEPRTDEFTPTMGALVEMYADWLYYELSQTNGSPTFRRGVEPSEPPELTSPQIDSLLEGLQKPERRSVLLALLDERRCSIDRLEEVLEGDRAEQRLYHIHLPKLEEAGYVEWNRATGTISRGPDFWDVEPLVRLLDSSR